MLEPLWTGQQVVDYLGVPIATLYAMNSKGTAPRRLCVGRYVRYRPEDVQAWLAARYVPGSDPPTAA